MENKKEWTIMVYMAGDNNLSEDMIRAIVELRKEIKHFGDIHFSTGFGEKNQVNFIMQFDGSHPAMDTKYYNLTYTNNRSYRQDSSPQNIPETSPSYTANSEHISQDLKKFLEKAIKENPASHYALIISGHSDAFLGRTLLLDENPNGVTTLRNISHVLSEIDIPQSGFYKGRKLDILGFDSCVMNTIEVLYEFENNAHTFIGSQGSIPNFTWDYKTIGKNLMIEKRQHLSKNKIINVIKESIEKYNQELAFGGRSLDFCAVELEEIKLFANKIAESSYYIWLIFLIFRQDTYIGSRILRVFTLAHKNSQTFMQNQAVDIIDLCQQLRIECAKVFTESFFQIHNTNSIEIDIESEELSVEVSNWIQEIEKNLITYLETNSEKEIDFNEICPNTLFVVILYLIYKNCFEIYKKAICLINNGMFIGSDYQFSNGISIFFPWSYLAFRMTLLKYKELKFFQDFPIWGWFIYTFTILTARPKQNLYEFSPIILLIPQMFPGAPLPAQSLNLFSNRLKAQSTSISTETDKLDEYKQLLIKILGSDISFKDSPPNSKGFDTYLQYFSKTSNIFPDLNLKGSFHPKITSEIED